jgi:UDP-glucuronate decarboxylase
VLGTLQVMELANRVGARVLLASTSEIYGDPAISPQVEDYFGNVNPIGPRACYDESKRCAEAILVAYKAQFKTDSRIARIFNTYGPRLRPDDGRVVSNFICQALTKTPITVYGDGSQTRSFCYVSDTVRGLCALMNSEKDPGPINIGNPEEISIKTLASKILYMTQTAPQINYRMLPKDDPKRRCPDISKAKRCLNWEPTIGLESGLKRTVSYFLAKLKLEPSTCLHV